MAKRLVVANWKMYIERHETAAALAKELKRKLSKLTGVDVVLAPAFPLIPAVSMAVRKTSVRIAGQTLSKFEDGARTGEVSGLMLKNSGASAVIVGHSERRAEGESDEDVRAQIKQAGAAGLRIILCIGEAEREASGAHFSLVADQLRRALSGEGRPPASKLVIAYEPVWAIGKSAAFAMKPAEVEESVLYIRKILAETYGRAEALRIPVLYGGAVEPENAGELIADGGVSGFLVGHASTDPAAFLRILTAAASRKQDPHP